jgi:hypothetical protein
MEFPKVLFVGVLPSLQSHLTTPNKGVLFFAEYQRGQKDVLFFLEDQQGQK